MRTIRFPGLASSYWGAFPPVYGSDICPFVGFTVTGIARNFHPRSLGASFSRRRARVRGAQSYGPFVPIKSIARARTRVNAAVRL